MTVSRLWLASGEVTVTGTGYAPSGEFERGDHPLEAAEDPDLKALATIFGRLLISDVTVSDRLATREAKAELYNSVLEAFKQLPREAQAWLLAVIPRTSVEVIDPFVEVVLESGDPAAILVSLARFADSPSARPITVATSSGNESLIRAGAAVRDFIVARIEQEAKKLELPPG